MTDASMPPTHPNVARVEAARRNRQGGDEVRAATGFAIGGVPPFGHARPLRVLVDAHLLEHALVWAAAGLPDAVFSIEPAELARVAGAERASLAANAGA